MVDKQVKKELLSCCIFDRFESTPSRPKIKTLKPKRTPFED
jgi:hypothetical protein